MRFPLIEHYRPTKTADGEGGFTETLGTDLTLYAQATVHQADMFLFFRRGEDVQREDIVVIDGDQYRVLRLEGPEAAPVRRAKIERIERPIRT